MKGHQQPTGHAQSPLSSAFPIIISSTLANSLHGLEDYVLHLCVVKSVHSALQMMCLPLAVRGISSCFLRLANFVTGGDRATI